MITELLAEVGVKLAEKTLVKVVEVVVAVSVLVANPTFATAPLLPAAAQVPSPRQKVVASASVPSLRLVTGRLPWTLSGLPRLTFPQAALVPSV